MLLSFIKPIPNSIFNVHKFIQILCKVSYTRLRFYLWRIKLARKISKLPKRFVTDSSADILLYIVDILTLSWPQGVKRGALKTCFYNLEACTILK